MVKFVKKCIKETIIKLNSLELFRVDRKLMIFLGCWPANFDKRKLIVIFCVLFTFDFLPKLNYFTKSILESDPQTFAVSCTEVILIFCLIWQFLTSFTVGDRWKNFLSH